MPRDPTVKVRAGARVTVTLEISNVGARGLDCGLDQIFKQAAESAIGRLRNGIGQCNWRLIGEPKVVAVMVDDNDRETNR